MDAPPKERGEYAVRLSNGDETTARWDGAGWVGLTDVAAYSGRLMSLTLDQQLERIYSILAGTALRTTNATSRLAISQAHALEMARHFASEAEARGVKKSLVDARRRNSLGFYGVAKALGVTVDSLKLVDEPAPHETTRTDFALIEAYNRQFPGLFLETARMVDARPGGRTLEEWAIGALEGRQKAIAKAQRRAQKAAAAVAANELRPATATTSPADEEA
ncbi:hypothetical protein [Paraburkholderia sp. SIMBA_054]|uniref:hypothetical protein n=1 Tax=Paraburkholderia sp. SIMBA_054 TaxID=3085795 RepID=UPI00397B8010